MTQRGHGIMFYIAIALMIILIMPALGDIRNWIQNRGIINPPYPTGLKIALFAYGTGKDPDSWMISLKTVTQHMAQFDMVLVDPTFRQWVPKLKASNPNIKVFVYVDIMYGRPSWRNWNYIITQEEAFKHYRTSGARVQQLDGDYLMDLNDPVFMQYMIDRCNYESEGFDGIFMDNVWSGFEWQQTEWINYQDIDAWTPDFQTAMKQLITAVANGFNKPLIVNSSKYTPYYTNVIDQGGKCAENYLPMELLSAFNWIKEQSEAQNKYYICLSEGNTESSMMYALTASLIGINSQETYFASNALGIWTPPAFGYWPQFEDAKRLGQPTGAYYPIQSVYARNFQYGTVLFNPSSITYTITVAATQIVVPAWSGKIVI